MILTNLTKNENVNWIESCTCYHKLVSPPECSEHFPTVITQFLEYYSVSNFNLNFNECLQEGQIDSKLWTKGTTCIL